MSNPFAQIGVVTGYEYTQNREGEQTVTMLQVSLSEEDDVQSVELYQPVGRNGPPTIDSAVIVISIAEGFKIAIGINDGLDVSELSEGDILAYSQDQDGVRRTEVKQENDGTLTLSSIDNDELGCASQTLQNSGVVDIQNENGSINLAANGTITLDTALKVLIGSASASEALLKGTSFISAHNTWVAAITTVVAALVDPTGIDGASKSAFATASTNYQTALSNILSLKGFTE